MVIPAHLEPGSPTSLLKGAGLPIGLVAILGMLFVPLPPILIDISLGFSIALAILILMVALWIERPLEFSSFPTILLVSTLLRLALNIATTRLILTEGASGTDAAGHVIAGFANFIMGGDFVIGTIVFIILVTVNFIVISKGATRIAEVGARFTLDAIPGKQMAIDADLSAGAIDDREATKRRRELEEESAFFGAMDGASKFVRGDAIAGLVITVVNVFGGIIIGMFRHDMTLGAAADVYTKLSVGDGLVSQIPALIISLAAGLLVSKGGAKGSAGEAVAGQLSNHPHALTASACVMGGLALAPGLPFFAFAVIGVALAGVSALISQTKRDTAQLLDGHEGSSGPQHPEPFSVKEGLRTPEIEVCIGKQLANSLLANHDQMGQRVAKMRRKFAKQFGFIIPEIKITHDLGLNPKHYQIKLHGTMVATYEMRIGDFLVVIGDGHAPSVPFDETKEPAFGIRAGWVSSAFEPQLRSEALIPIDNMSVLLTHLGEVIRCNLSQLLSYRDMRGLLERLDPEYRRLIDELIPSQISYSGLQAVLKALLAECISIRNISLILEAIAEIAPHARRTEQICEHVRSRMAQQICGDLLDEGVLKIVRLGSRWDLTFHQSLKRDAKGDVIEFDVDPKLIEQFGADCNRILRPLLSEGHQIVMIAPPEARIYVRMITERLFPMLPVLSHVEISRGVQISALGALS